MKIVFNSSPLIFLSQLNFLELFLQYDYQFYVPKVVINEINAKQDEASNYVNVVVANNSLIVKQINLFSLANSNGHLTVLRRPQHPCPHQRTPWQRRGRSDRLSYRITI